MSSFAPVSFLLPPTLLHFFSSSRYKTAPLTDKLSAASVERLYLQALKLELYAKTYYYWKQNITTNESCWRWPAIACDGYAGKGYGGTNPQLMPGSLLAVGPADARSLLPLLKTVPGRKIMEALRDYGGYLVDDTASPSAAFCAEHSVNAEVLAEYGWDIRVRMLLCVFTSSFFRCVFLVRSRARSHVQ